MNMHLSSFSRLLFLHLISYHYIAGAPSLLSPSTSPSAGGAGGNDAEAPRYSSRANSTEGEEASSTDNDFYRGYPQQEEMKDKLPYLLAHLEATDSLSLVNLALWKTRYSSQEEACSAVDKYTRKLEQAGSCRPSYSCDYDKDRFPSTLIAMKCGESYCGTTNYGYPVRGSCLGKQSFIMTLKFEEEQEEEEESQEGSSGDEDDGGEMHHDANDLERKGTWIHERLNFSSRCSCRAK